MITPIDPEDGKISVTKKKEEAKSEDPSAGHEGEPVHVKDEEHQMHARHNLERHMLHGKHEHEHAQHAGGDKAEMDDRHAKEHHNMLKSHDEQLAGINENEGAEPGE
jgi:hypothetical protein